MDNLTITTYRYYSANDIGWTPEDEYEQVEDGKDQSGIGAVFMLNTYDSIGSDTSDATLASMVVAAFESSRYIQSNVRRYINEKSVVYAFTGIDDLDTEVTDNIANIDTIAIFDQEFLSMDLSKLDINTYYEHILSVGQLAIPMMLKSSNRWDIDLTIALSNSNNKDLNFSIRGVYSIDKHYKECVATAHGECGEYLNNYGLYSNANIDTEVYKDSTPEVIKVGCCSTDGYSYIYACKEIVDDSEFDAVDLSKNTSIGPALTPNICIEIDDNVNVCDIHLGISQDHGIYAYYVTNDVEDRDKKYKIVYDKNIGYSIGTLSNIPSKVKCNTYPFVDDLYETKNIEKGIYTQATSTNSYTYHVDRGTCTATICTPYLNYTGTSYKFNNYDLYNSTYLGSVADYTNPYACLMSFSEPTNDKYPVNDVPTFNYLIYGSNAMPMTLSILNDTTVDNGEPKSGDANNFKLHEVRNYIDCTARMALLTMRDTYNAYISKLDSNSYWKLYDNAAVTYCCDGDYHYVNVLKYSALSRNPIYRVVLPKKSDEIYGISYSYSDLCINYNSNTLIIDTKITCSDGTTSTSSTYRLFYDTLGDYKYVCYYTICTGSTGESFMYCLHGNRYYIHVNEVDDSKGTKCIVINNNP